MNRIFSTEACCLGEVHMIDPNKELQIDSKKIIGKIVLRTCMFHDRFEDLDVWPPLPLMISSMLCFLRIMCTEGLCHTGLQLCDLSGLVYLVWSESSMFSTYAWTWHSWLQGNVAVDAARILLRSPEELATTDIAEHALAALRESCVRCVAFNSLESCISIWRQDSCAGFMQFLQRLPFPGYRNLITLSMIWQSPECCFISFLEIQVTQ